MKLHKCMYLIYRNIQILNENPLVYAPADKKCHLYSLVIPFWDYGFFIIKQKL